MALVELTRFDDMQEAQIAAGALDAAGIPAICHDLGWGSVDFLARIATQGFAIWVEEEDLDEARAFVSERRTFNRAALTWIEHPRSLIWMPVALLAAIEPVTGLMLASARQKPTAARVAIAVAMFLAMWAAIIGLWFLATVVRNAYPL
jgi:hypothetical protein